MNPTGFDAQQPDMSQQQPQLSSAAQQPFGGYNAQSQSPRSHRVRNGVLWILSGPMLLGVSIVLQLLFRAIFADTLDDEGAANMTQVAVSLLIWILGMVSFLLFFVIGPIMAVITLTKKEKQ